MPQNLHARRAAAAVPLVLFGPYGRTVESYRPADEDLTGALSGVFTAKGYVPVQGPYLRRVHSRERRTGTGIVGVSISREHATGRHFVRVRFGGTCRRFCIETLGRTEALRRAIALRREHVAKLAQANEVILRARARNAVAVPVGGVS